MEINWDAFGAMAEAVGAIAVLLTILYLSSQVRQANRLMRAQHREATRNALAEVQDPIIRDKDFAQLMLESGENIQALDDADLRRVFEQCRNELTLAQSMFVTGRLVNEDRSARIGARMALRQIESHVVAAAIWKIVEWDEDFSNAVEELRAKAVGKPNVGLRQLLENSDSP